MRYNRVQRTPAQRRAEDVEDRADNLLDLLVKGVPDTAETVFSVTFCEALVTEAFRLAEAFQVEVDKRRTAADTEENQS